MIEIGIPCYHAKNTLPDALNSLVAQTFKRFIVCLSIDGDREDYSDIIQEYIRRGLKIRLINNKENGGPGMARQRILDTTMCDYLMFLDADDMLTPRAVEVLLNGIRANNYDILMSPFIREYQNKSDVIMSQDTSSIITWFHGKIYKVDYLKNRNINFHPFLRTDEDAYFNLIAIHSTEKRGTLKEITYIWRDNKNSLTRKDSQREYLRDNGKNYIYSQVEALKYIYKINNDEDVPSILLTQELINIYYYYMRLKFFKEDKDMTNIDNILIALKNEDWMQKWIIQGENWIDVSNQIKQSCIYDDNGEKYVCFYEEPFNNWIKRLLKRDW